MKILMDVCTEDNTRTIHCVSLKTVIFMMRARKNCKNSEHAITYLLRQMIFRIRLYLKHRFLTRDVIQKQGWQTRLLKHNKVNCLLEQQQRLLNHDFQLNHLLTIKVSCKSKVLCKLLKQYRQPKQKRFPLLQGMTRKILDLAFMQLKRMM